MGEIMVVQGAPVANIVGFNEVRRYHEAVDRVAFGA